MPIKTGGGKPPFPTLSFCFLSHLHCLNAYPTYSSATSASGKIVRISKIEIIGRKRMNRNNKVKKNPIVPMNMVQSQVEG